MNTLLPIGIIENDIEEFADAWETLAKTMRCGGCRESTTVDSPHSCTVCGRMLCGNCGKYCTIHRRKENVKPVLSCIQGDNSDLIRGVMRIYTNPGDSIADVTYGRGVFWKKVDLDDYELYGTDLKTGTDFRSLPYEDESMGVVVIDPPYMYHSSTTHKESIDKGYRNNERVEEGIHGVDAVHELYRQGMTEAMRVLKPKGTMWVKCMDQIMSGKQHRQHIAVFDIAIEMGLIDEDLFILMQKGVPTMRHDYQLHSRKNFSYLWVFRKR